MWFICNICIYFKKRTVRSLLRVGLDWTKPKSSTGPLLYSKASSRMNTPREKVTEGDRANVVRGEANRKPRTS